MQHTTHMVESISYVCAASVLYEYQTRFRRKLMKRAKECFNQCDLDLFQSASASLVGDEATKYIVKLMEITVNWEVDLLLHGLKRELENASEVDYNPGRLLSFVGPLKAGEKQRLMNTRAEIRPAPVVVIMNDDAADTGTQCASRLVNSRLDCRYLEFSGGLEVDPPGVQPSSLPDGSLLQNTYLAFEAVATVLKNYRQICRARWFARRGMPVIVSGYPVVDFPGVFSVPKLKFWVKSDNLVWRLIARFERFVYEKISSHEVDHLIVVASSQNTGPVASDVNAFEIRRRSQAMKDIPINAKSKKLIDAYSSPLEVQAQIVEQILIAVADR